jgi:hypothetical protein
MMTSERTFVEAIHIQLAHEGRNVGMLKILTGRRKHLFLWQKFCTYESTFEKSLDGDITKLSAELDQAIRCRIL